MPLTTTNLGAFRLPRTRCGGKFVDRERKELHCFAPTAARHAAIFCFFAKGHHFAVHQPWHQACTFAPDTVSSFCLCSPLPRDRPCRGVPWSQVYRVSSWFCFAVANR